MDQKIPPRNTWNKLSINELYAVKSDMLTLFYNARGASASYAAQYGAFVNEIDALIAQKQALEELEEKKDDAN